MSEKFVRIRQQEGNFNLADPSQTTQEVRVEIEELGFEGKWSFEPGTVGNLRAEPWDEVLDLLSGREGRTVKSRRSARKAAEVLREHGGRIRREWVKWRIGVIEEKIEDLREERTRLASELDRGQDV